MLWLIFLYMSFTTISTRIFVVLQNSLNRDFRVLINWFEQSSTSWFSRSTFFRKFWSFCVENMRKRFHEWFKKSHAWLKICNQNNVIVCFSNCRKNCNCIDFNKHLHFNWHFYDALSFNQFEHVDIFFNTTKLECDENEYFNETFKRSKSFRTQKVIKDCSNAASRKLIYHFCWLIDEIKTCEFCCTIEN